MQSSFLYAFSYNEEVESWIALVSSICGMVFTRATNSPYALQRLIFSRDTNNIQTVSPRIETEGRVPQRLFRYSGTKPFCTPSRDSFRKTPGTNHLTKVRWFQFLIGRPQTCEEIYVGISGVNTFQFLIGRLQTHVSIEVGRGSGSSFWCVFWLCVISNLR